MHVWNFFVSHSLPVSRIPMYLNFDFGIRIDILKKEKSLKKKRNCKENSHPVEKGAKNVSTTLKYYTIQNETSLFLITTHTI